MGFSAHFSKKHPQILRLLRKSFATARAPRLAALPPCSTTTSPCPRPFTRPSSASARALHALLMSYPPGRGPPGSRPAGLPASSSPFGPPSVPPPPPLPHSTSMGVSPASHLQSPFGPVLAHVPPPSAVPSVQPPPSTAPAGQSYSASPFHTSPSSSQPLRIRPERRRYDTPRAATSTTSRTPAPPASSPGPPSTSAPLQSTAVVDVEIATCAAEASSLPLDPASASEEGQELYFWTLLHRGCVIQRIDPSMWLFQDWDLREEKPHVSPRSSPPNSSALDWS